MSSPRYPSGTNKLRKIKGRHADLEVAIESLETSWLQETNLRLEDLLAHGPGALCQPALLAELVHTELELRLRKGETARVEDYLTRFPQLQPESSAILSFIGTEYLFRQPSEPTLTLESFVDRFPQLEQRIRDRFSIGRFQFLSLLGSGTFGLIWKAEDLLLDRVVAIKVPNPANTLADGEVQSFLAEARSASCLNHPGIATLYDMGIHEGQPYLVSEYVPGPTLAMELRRERMPLRSVVAIVGQLADGLAHAHEREVVHRDIKPSNIILRPLDRKVDTVPSSKSELGIFGAQWRIQFQATILDFGLARRSFPSTGPNAPRQILGTPAYMSPEQVEPGRYPIDHRSDLYSLGIVFYEMLTGRLPFSGSSKDVLQQVCHGSIERPSTRCPEVPESLCRICMGCLRHDPADRWQTAMALREELQSEIGKWRASREPWA